MPGALQKLCKYKLTLPSLSFNLQAGETMLLLTIMFIVRHVKISYDKACRQAIKQAFTLKYIFISSCFEPGPLAVKVHRRK